MALTFCVKKSEVGASVSYGRISSFIRLSDFSLQSTMFLQAMYIVGLVTYIQKKSLTNP